MKPIPKSRQAIFWDKAESWMRPYMPGYIDHPVYSTWAMIRAMECAARELLQPYLEKGEDAVGCEVSAKHLAPSPIGARIRIEARLIEVKGPVVTCQLSAFHGKSKIGEGIHKQFVFDARRYQKFLNQVKKKK